MNILKGKTAVVTGGSRGFGRGISAALAAEGMRVIAIARKEESLAQLKRDINGDVITISGDITNPILAARVIAEHKPHVLVLNAGARSISRPTRFHTWETFSEQYEVDFKSTFNWVREALLLPLEKGSAIVIGSSGACFANFPLVASYASAKAAQWAFARCVAGEAKELGINVHCLLPNMSPETEMGREGMEDFERYLSNEERLKRRSTDTEVSLTPTFLGKAVVRILTDPNLSKDIGFRITGSDIQPCNA